MGIIEKEISSLSLFHEVVFVTKQAGLFTSNTAYFNQNFQA